MQIRSLLKIKGLAFILVLLTIQTVSAQVLTPVKWSFDASALGNDEYELRFKADIEKDWTVYSQHSNDEGPVPTYVEFEELNGASLVGESIEKGHKKEGYDKLFEVNVIKFVDDEPYTIVQKVKATDLSKPITGYLTYMTCDQTRCLPPKDVDFSFDLSALAQTAVKKTTAAVEKVVEKTQVVKTQVQETLTQEANAAKEKVVEAPAKIKEGIKEVAKKAPMILGAATGMEEDNYDTDEDHGKMLDPVKWTMSIKEAGNDEYELIYTADIDDEWTVYSQHSSDDGPVPTYIEYEELNGATLVGESIEEGHLKEGPDPLFDNINVIKFLGDEDYTITQKIKKGTGPIKGYLSYMTCDKSHCKPPTDVEFEFDPAMMYAGDKRPEASGVAMNVAGGVLDQAIGTIQETYAEPLADCGTQISSANASYWKIFLGGFIGGLLAILMPCIFPMIPITVSFFTKDTKTKGWVNGLVYGLSIIVIFVALGVSITALLGPTALNELSTNWIANVIFFLVFIAFAISFFGYFEIALPSSWSTKTDKMADKGGLIGTFFMAATLAIVSFSCTGPIIGSALVQVADDPMGPAVIMFGFALALAIPFGLFAAFPAWLNSLPRSGSWMTSVKVVLGFLELALALKFLSVADMTSGWGFLKYELFMGLWVIIFAAMTAYLFGYIKFPHDSPIKKLGTTRKLFAFAALGWTIYMASGFMIDKDNNSYTIPKAVSGITPPASYNFFLTQNELDPAILAKYPSFTKCANDINCFKDYYDGVSYANEVGKPVLLDFTGYGCVNCRKTEDYIWKDPAIKKSLNDDYVLVSLYVDDRKKLKETLVSKMSGDKLRNIGNKWADFQIVNFKQNSQPLYVPMTPSQEVLTAPRGYEEGVDNYKQFLDCGLKAFNDNK